MFRSYINYLMVESEQVKRFHGALWAGVFTGVFACIYVYTLYDITPPMPYSKSFENKTEYNRKDNNQYMNNDPEIKNYQLENPQTATKSPFAALKSFWHDAVNGISTIQNK